MQAGHLEQVGYDTYCKLLDEVIKERQGEAIEEEKDIQIDLSFSSYIPEEYIENIYYGNKLNARPQIRAFVIGDSIDSSISKFKTQEDFGKLYAYTYDQLVRTAEKRFFNLKSKLEEHYSQFNGDDYVKAILNEPEQLRLPGV